MRIAVLGAGGIEVEALSGAVVARGRRAGVPTPVHQTIAACLSLGRPAPAPVPE